MIFWFPGMRLLVNCLLLFVLSSARGIYGQVPNLSDSHICYWSSSLSCPSGLPTGNVVSGQRLCCSPGYRPGSLQFISFPTTSCSANCWLATVPSPSPSPSVPDTLPPPSPTASPPPNSPSLQVPPPHLPQLTAPSSTKSNGPCNVLFILLVGSILRLLPIVSCN